MTRSSRWSAVVGVLLLAGCGGTSSGEQSPSAAPVTVFAASSLTNAFPAVATAFEQQAGSATTFSFAGSQELVAQIAQGAPADVVATADPQTMSRVVAQLVSPAQTFAHNQLVIVTAPGNPHHITSLANLADPHLVVVLAAPAVPAGTYARTALADAHVQVTPRSLEPDVRGVLTKVELGEADAGIVYRSDAQSAGSRVATVGIPHGPVASYQIGALDRGGTPFVRFVMSPAGQQILRRYGFDR